MAERRAVSQRLVFGEVAELYERLRPGYPGELIDALVAGAAVDGRSRILEVGCGTGQATRSLAERGLAVLALEPDPAMAAVARRMLAPYPAIAIVESDFENAPLDEGAFDLVVAALALHWVAPEVRFAKPARLLKPGGWMAFFANRPVLDGSPLRAEIDAAYARHAPHMREGAPGPTRPIDTPLAEELEAHPDFGPVWRAEFPWSQRQDRDDYLDLMRTQSDHRMLGAEARDALLTAIGEAIDRHGGHIELRWNAILSMARRS